jgi:zinc finger protein
MHPKLESFSCEHCNFSDNSIKSAGEIQQRGSKYTLVVENEQDLARQVVRSDFSTFTVHITNDIELPRGKGQLTNVEGVIQVRIPSVLVLGAY